MDFSTPFPVETSNQCLLIGGHQMDGQGGAKESQEEPMINASWLLLALPGCSWLLLAPPGFSWLLLAPHGSSWLLLAPRVIKGDRDGDRGSSWDKEKE